MDALPTESILYFEQHIRTLLKKHQEAEKQAREQVMRAYQKSDGITVVLQRRMPWCAFLIPTTAVLWSILQIEEDFICNVSQQLMGETLLKPYCRRNGLKIHHEDVGLSIIICF